MTFTRSQRWLALLTALTLVGGVVAWRVVAARDRDTGIPPGHHAGPGAVEPPEMDVTSVRAGAWSDPATWGGGAVPTERDLVGVEHAVTLDTPAGEARELWLSAPLTFGRGKDVRLTMHGSVVVIRGGVLDIRQPNPKRTSVLAFDVDDEEAMVGGFDFRPEDTGLWVLSGGRVELHGAPVRETWAKLLAPASPGDRSLHVSPDVSDWPKGAEAVLSATGNGRKQESEVVRVTGGGEGTVSLAAPVKFEHLGGEHLAGELGLLTHNVRVESLDPKNRAHVFFYGGAGGGITHTQFDRMGPAEQFSRYALHFHVMRDSSRGMEVRGSSFRGSGTFWLNIHGSNGMTIADNVGYRARGAGFYMEHPAGRDNTWIHNLGVEVAPSDKLQHRNSVFWFLLGNALIDNVGVGAYGGASSSGIFIPQQPRDDPALEARTTILHNEAHSNRQYGFASWMNLSPEFHVVDLLLWRNADAGFHWGAYGTRFKVFRVRAFDNGEYDVEARVKGLYLVDSEMAGAPVGMFFANPVVNTNIENPSQVIRGSFGDHSGHDVAIDQVRECKRTTGRCPPMYLQFVDSVFASASPIRFGWQWDPGTRMWFQNVATQREDLPASFVLVREDQPRPSPGAVKDAGIGAWVSPSEPIVDDRPPLAETPKVRRTGETVRFSVRASDDARVETIEFLLNGVPVASEMAVADIPRYAFLVARVTDVAGNVSYSPSVDVGGLAR